MSASYHPWQAVEENQMIKKQNVLLQKVIATFGKVSGALSMWKEWLNDIRRKPVLYQKCGKCNQTAYLKTKEKYNTQREKLAGRYKAKTTILP